MDEFALIDSIFAQLTTAGSPALGLGDDAAVLSLPAGQDLVFTKDMMVAGRHFFASDPPDNIAAKLMRVNLSDLAAMGAQPLGYLLAIAFPGKLDAAFARQFAVGLARDQKAYDIALYGGDTVSGAELLTLSLTAIGCVPHGAALLRSGAQVGDRIYVSGTIGDAALGLLCLQGDIDRDDRLLERYYKPEPRLGLGMALRGIASAAIDISDGLVADLGHICRQSAVGAVIYSDAVPLSAAVLSQVEKDRTFLKRALTGGDDYELLFTVSKAYDTALRQKAEQTGVPITLIGEVVHGADVRICDADGGVHKWDYGGYRHP